MTDYELSDYDTITVSRTVETAAAEPSERSHVLDVATMFGLGVDEQRQLELIPPTRLPIRPGSLIFVTGPSGSGKSTLLALIAECMPKVIWFDALSAPPESPLLDGFGDALLEDALRWLSLAGLNDAFVMLRLPSQLSDGQRYRLRLARLMAEVERGGGTHGDRPVVVLADEFGATLDRTTASVVARNLRKWATRSGVCFVAATTHDDLLEPLDPDVLVYKDLGGAIHVEQRSIDQADG